MDTGLLKRTSLIISVIFTVATIPNAADVDHSKDREIENCLVRSYTDDFAEEIVNILMICHGDRESGTIRVDFFPVTQVAQVSLWDRQLGASAWARNVTRIPEVVIRFDDKRVIRLIHGIWSDDIYGMGRFIVDDELIDILDEMVSAKKVRYRITYSKDYIGEVKEVYFPHGVSELVVEFVHRTEDYFER